MKFAVSVLFGSSCTNTMLTSNAQETCSSREKNCKEIPDREEGSGGRDRLSNCSARLQCTPDLCNFDVTDKPPESNHEQGVE